MSTYVCGCDWAGQASAFESAALWHMQLCVCGMCGMGHVSGVRGNIVSKCAGQAMSHSFYTDKAEQLKLLHDPPAAGVDHSTWTSIISRHPFIP